MNGHRPTPDEVAAFRLDLRRYRENLARLLREQSDESELGAQIDQLGEQLMVADEELRVQSESLSQSSEQLAALAAAYEELFSGAPTPYVQTDEDGVVLRYNRAASRLLALPDRTARSLVLPNLLDADDRGTVRSLISRLRTQPELALAGPVEVAVRRPDGTSRLVVLSGRRFPETGTGRVMLHWELHGQSGLHSVDAEPVLAGQGARDIAEAIMVIAAQDRPDVVLAETVRQAAATITACDAAGIVLAASRGGLQPAAASSEQAAECDRLQCEIGEGPVLVALGDGRPLRVGELAADGRWPTFAASAEQIGFRSALVAPLGGVQRPVGALALYAAAADAFDEVAERVATAFAVHAGLMYTHIGLEANLRQGLQTREEIGRAVGILMERHRVTASAAFEMLVRASQRGHRKLREIAQRVTETGEDPTLT